MTTLAGTVEIQSLIAGPAPIVMLLASDAPIVPSPDPPPPPPPSATPMVATYQKANSSSFSGSQKMPLTETWVLDSDFHITEDQVFCDFDGTVRIGAEATLVGVSGSGNRSGVLGIRHNEVTIVGCKWRAYSTGSNHGSSGSASIPTLAVKDGDRIDVLGTVTFGGGSMLFPADTGRLTVERIG